MEVILEGKDAAIAALRQDRALVLRGLEVGMRDVLLLIRGRVKARLAAGPHPLSRTGALSRSIINQQSTAADGVTGIVGSTMPYKTGYAAILEKGGAIPEIRPKKGKFLRFVRAAGLSGIAHQAVLQRRGTYKQAGKAAMQVSRRMGENPWVFVRSVPARYQRAMPYLHPSFDETRGDITVIFRRRIKEALGGATASGGG